MGQKILLVDDQEEILEILQLYIEGSFEVETILASGGLEAIEILKTEDICSIVCDYRMPEGDGSLVYDFNESHSKLPFAWHSATFDSDIKDNKKLNKKHIFHINKPSSEEEVCSSVTTMLSLSKEVSDLKKIRISILRKMPSIEISLYLKLNETKKLLINQDGDSFPLKKLEDLETKGVEFLYISNTDFDTVTNYFWSQFSERIKKAGTIEDIFFVVDDYVKGINQTLIELGVSQTVLEVGLKCANACLKQINKDDALRVLLAGKIDRNNYISNHSLLTVQLASIFIEDKDLLELLAQAVIFHDLSLNNERLAKIHLDDPDFEKLTPAEQELVKSHGMKISKVISDLISNKDVLKIIENHHRYEKDHSWIKNCSVIELAFFISHEMAHICCTQDLNSARVWLKDFAPYVQESIYETFYNKIAELFKI